MIVGFEVRGGEGVFEGNERIGVGLMRSFGSVRQGRLRRGFTRLDMAMLMVMLGLLLAMLILWIENSRELARKTECRSHIKILAVSMHNFAEAYNHFPDSCEVWGKLKGSNEIEIDRVMSWGTSILGYIDSGPGYHKHLYLVPPFAKVNAPYVGLQSSIFRCPSAPGSTSQNNFRMPKGTVLYSPFSTAEDYSATYGAADYIVHCGVTEGFRKAVYQEGEIPKDGVGALGPIQFHPDEALAKAMMKELGEVPIVKHSSFTDVKDGDSNTILISESAGRNELWRKGRRIGEKQDPSAYARQKMMGGGGWADPFNQAWINGRQADGTGTNGPCAINCSNEPDAGLYSFHAGGAHAALVDGSVRFLNEKLSPMILGRLVMRADGEKIEGEF